MNVGIRTSGLIDASLLHLLLHPFIFLFPRLVKDLCKGLECHPSILLKDLILSHLFRLLTVRSININCVLTSHSWHRIILLVSL